MKRFLLFFAVQCCMLVALAQQNVGFRATDLVSPQVNADHTVTFRLIAPKAESVKVVGDWAGESAIAMVKTPDGVWEATTMPLVSEMYTYRFNIDGVMTLDPVNPFTRRDVGNWFSIFYVKGGVADYYQVRDVPHGNVTTTWYHSDAAGADRRLTIYTPAAYNTSKKRRFPVFYLLHGSGGDETAWLDLGHTARILDNLIAEGKAEPMIVVIPNGNLTKDAAPGETSEGLDFRPCMSNQMPGYKDGRYETNFTEIIRFTEQNYRCLADKKHRAVAGLSMGGFHTFFIALNHPDTFDYIGLFSAGMDFSKLDMNLPAYTDIDGKLQRLQRSGYKYFWQACGDEDFLWEANQQVYAQMQRNGLDVDFYKSSRGHLWSNWRQYLVLFSQKLFK